MQYQPNNPSDPFNRAVIHADTAILFACFGMIVLPLVYLMQDPTNAPTTTQPEAAPIAMMDVDSSQIKSIGYDAATQTLAVNFKTGGVYFYSGFPIEEWSAFRTAASIGSYFYKNIKGKYAFTKQ